MAFEFQKIATKGQAAGIPNNNTRQAREWYRAAAQNVVYAKPDAVIDSAEPFELMRNLSINSIGKMYLFNYDPKHKETLPYYDTFPLIFPIEFDRNSFLGINLHYLPLTYRAALMDSLYNTINNEKRDKTTALRLSYKILKSASQLRAFEPCLKRYLAEHVRSSFLYVKPIYWDMALFLPLERFEKKNKSYVQNQSVSKIRK